MRHHRQEQLHSRQEAAVVDVRDRPPWNQRMELETIMSSITRLALFVSVGVLSSSCGDNDAENRSSVSRGNLTDAKLCIAGIAALNSRPVAGMSVDASSETILISYVRLDDAKNFTYGCRIEGDQIRWKDPYTGWNKNVRLNFQVDGSTLTIEQRLDGESLAKQSFAIREL